MTYVPSKHINQLTLGLVQFSWLLSLLSYHLHEVIIPTSLG